MKPRFPRRIHLSVPHMSGREQAFVQRAFDSNWVSTVGPNLRDLEAKMQALVGRPAVALSSGTAAIHLALRVLGVKHGDEVLSPTLTFVASCNPILYEGARPLFIDSEPGSWNIDPNLVSKVLKKRASVNKLPSAVIVVHLFGQTAQMDDIMSICREFNVPVVEDAAESLGARFKDQLAGAFGDVAIFSLNGNKIITASSGGIFSSPNEDFVRRARYLSAQATDPGLDYLHSEPGYNYRMSNVLAGIALGQLEVLNERIAQRRAVAFRYQSAFQDVAGLTLMPEAPERLHTYWLSCFLVNEDQFGMSKESLIRHLDEANIEARPVWKPMHTQKLFRGYECIGGAVAEDLNKRGICLPSSSSLTEDEQQFVIDCVREAHLNAKGKFR